MLHEVQIDFKTFFLVVSLTGLDYVWLQSMRNIGALYILAGTLYVNAVLSKQVLCISVI